MRLFNLDIAQRDEVVFLYNLPFFGYREGVLERKDLEKLAELARIELPRDEEDKLFCDLEQILKHFDELKEIDTAKIPPLTGGTDLHNVLRDDEAAQSLTGSDIAPDQFPEKHSGFLKIPPVFE